MAAHRHSPAEAGPGSGRSDQAPLRAIAHQTRHLSSKKFADDVIAPATAVPRYIKVDKDQPHDPLLAKIATALYEKGFRLCRIDAKGNVDVTPESHTRHALSHMGHGVTLALWCYADTNLMSDNSLPVTRDELAHELGVPPEMLDAWPQTWLRFRDDGIAELPRYVLKNRIIAKDLRSDAREKGRVRQQRYRAKKKQHKVVKVSPRETSRDTAVTAALRNASTGTGIPIPVERSVTDVPASRPSRKEAGSLASALGRLARRPKAKAEQKNGHSNGNGHSKPVDLAALRLDARRLTRAGMKADEVVKLFGHQGIAPETVRAWIADDPPTQTGEPTNEPTNV